jgi:DNA replication and repair protein RecF
VLLKRLQLQHFRNYNRLDIAFGPGVTVLHGPNAAGKTNILEAIFALATTKSFRVRSEREVIGWSQTLDEFPHPYARVQGDIETSSRAFRIEMVVAENGRGGEEAPSLVRKQFRLNGSPCRASDIVGELKAVLFSPDDVDLITGAPLLRRRYMDVTLCQVDHTYLRALQLYGRVVQQRNALLVRLAGRRDPALLEFWDEKLIASGRQVVEARRAMLKLLTEFATELYADLSGQNEELTIRYCPSVEGAATEADIAAAFRAQLNRLARKESEQRITLVGPHRDDLTFLINGVSLQAYGSRGQQRMAALALRMAEARYMTNRTGERAILLLDEALSELDERRRELLLQFVRTYPQVIMTSANLAAFPEDFRQHATLFRVEGGCVFTEALAS